MTENRRDIPPDWYERSFDITYPIVYAHRTVESARIEVRFAIERLPVKPGATVLDLCCGNGRHMVHLLRHTSRVVGLDYSPYMLRFAASLVRSAGLLVRADMRGIPFVSAFDAVLNFFTSFGYFVSVEDNLRVAEHVARALKPSGVFFIDHLNRNHAIETLAPESHSEKDGFEVHEIRWIDAQESRINKSIAISQEGRPVGEACESVRLYTPDEFRDLLAAGGLRVQQFFGDYSGTPLDDSQPRMIAVGCKA